MTDYRTKAESWLSESFDEATRAEVQGMLDGDPAALEDAFYRNLEFGTGGLRGVMGVGTNRMNRYTVGMATQGLANYILSSTPGVEDKKVCISFDSRNHSREFARLAADVLSANGLHVYLFDDLRPTPELSFSIRETGAVAGIMITASHNPKEYNGYKVFWNDGAQITSPVDTEIIDEVNRVSDPSMVRFTAGENAGKVEIMGAEMDEKYMASILELNLSPEQCVAHSDLKLVYTPLHGCGVRLVPEVLSRLGFKNLSLVEEQCVTDGDFPTVVSPNPEEPSAMKLALEKADQVGADVVLATDPDADRMGVAVRDDKGQLRLLNGNQTASILTYYILSRRRELGLLKGDEYVVKTIVTTELISSICKDFGVKVYNVLTGFKYIAEVIREHEGFICGAEESYGFLSGTAVRDKDAQNAAATLAQAAAWAASRGLSLWGLLQEMYARYGYREEGLMSVVRKGRQGAEEIAATMASLRNDPPKSLCSSPVVKVVDYLDSASTGLRPSNVLQFFSEAGDVVSVRPSGTEPKIKFYFGAAGDDAHERLEELRKQFA